jgi:hypothetical protein
MGIHWPLQKGQTLQLPKQGRDPDSTAPQQTHLAVPPGQGLILID